MVGKEKSNKTISPKETGSGSPNRENPEVPDRPESNTTTTVKEQNKDREKGKS